MFIILYYNILQIIFSVFLFYTLLGYISSILSKVKFKDQCDGEKN